MRIFGDGKYMLCRGERESILHIVYIFNINSVMSILQISIFRKCAIFRLFYLFCTFFISPTVTFVIIVRSGEPGELYESGKYGEAGL